MTSRESNQPQQRYSFPVVAVGASAGGLESLERLLAPIPRKAKVAFVVVQHLSPKFKSLMDELLGRRTRLKVSVASHRTLVAPGHVYLLPPGQDIALKDGRLWLADKGTAEVVHHPIDHFFGSVAEELGDRAIGVVLSGTGSDGSRGVVAIHEHGGWTLCESDASAKFSGMPRSARATGCVDKVLLPEQMTSAIFVHANMADAAGLVDEVGDQDVSTTAILELLREAVDADFSGYKPAMIQRRIERRMALAQIADIAGYRQFLQHDASERDALVADLLIGVTRFFRDPACFAQLEQHILPEMIARIRGDNPLRVWIPACSTGQEPYSIAMLLREQVENAGLSLDRVKVFATDMHREALARASIGIYSEEQIESVPRDRVERHFRRVDAGFQVCPALRNMLVFAPHNVLADAPFTNVDFISCRNLLIYFQDEAQRRTLTLFHYALNQDGVLQLGPSESPGHLGHLFTTVDDTCRVYRRQTAPLPAEVPRMPAIQLTSSQRPGPSVGAATRPVSRDVLCFYDSLLERFMPPAILIDERRQVLDTYAGAERFLHIQPRRMSIDLLDLIHADLRGVMSGAIRRAQRDKEPFTIPAVRMRDLHGESVECDLSVEPIRSPRAQEVAYLLTLRPRPAATTEAADVDANAAANNGTPLDRGQVSVLEEELRYTRMSLQSTIEELETSNEKLQSANEELVAANEELQSTNEELNSVNEELYTVNTEYQNTITQLHDLNRDMEHLFASADVRTIFLDRELRLRRFTPSVCDQFQLVEQDIGRPLKSFSHSLDLPELHQQLEQVAKDGMPVEREVTDVSGRTFFLRILPCRADGKLDGIALTLIDIEALVATRRTLFRSEERLRQLTEALPILISYVDADCVYRHVNAAYSSFWNRPREEIVGMQVAELVGDEIYQQILPRIRRALQGEMQSFELELPGDGHRTIFERVVYVPHFERNGEVTGFFVAGTDVTELHQVSLDLEKARQDAEAASKAKSEFLANMSHEIRSPMTAILGFTDILSTRLTEPQNLEHLRTIQRNGQHLLTIINDILDLSKVEAGRLEIAKEDFSPVDLLIDVVRTMEVRAREKDLPLCAEFPQALPASIHSDPRRIRQILINLIGNAIKFTSSGQVDVRLVTTDPPDLALRFEVIDTGCGISEKHVANIFEPFTTGDGSSTREHEGSGLGLAISGRLADLLGGEILVESALGKGSTFTLRLPIADDVDRQWVAPEALKQALHEPTDVPAEPLPVLHGHILVVDDRRDNQLLVRHILERAGASVESVSDGIGAMEAVSAARATSRSFAALVLDMQMPGLDGHSVARRLRAGGFARPIVALTAAAMKGDRDRCIEAGCNAYLAKPIDGPALIRLLATLIEEQAGPGDCVAAVAPASDPLPATVLIVEDNRDACDAVARLLRMSGYQTRQAHNLAEARQTLQEIIPDAVVLDARLPDGDGLTFGRELRQDPRFASSRILALSGDDRIASRARDAGFDAVLSKPVDLSVLLDALARPLRD